MTWSHQHSAKFGSRCMKKSCKIKCFLDLLRDFFFRGRVTQLQSNTSIHFRKYLFCQAKKHYLSEFPGDAYGPAETIAANEQRLHGPASEMAKSKDVKVAQDPLRCDDWTVDSIFLEVKTKKRVERSTKRTATTKKYSHHDVSFPCSVTQVWIQPVHESLDLIPVQEDEQHEEQEVQNTDACREQDMSK